MASKPRKNTQKTMKSKRKMYALIKYKYFYSVEVIRCFYCFKIYKSY